MSASKLQAFDKTINYIYLRPIEGTKFILIQLHCFSQYVKKLNNYPPDKIHTRYTSSFFP